VLELIHESILRIILVGTLNKSDMKFIFTRGLFYDAAIIWDFTASNGMAGE
jgi:hypothetical protein